MGVLDFLDLLEWFNKQSYISERILKQILLHIGDALDQRLVLERNFPDVADNVAKVVSEGCLRH